MHAKDFASIGRKFNQNVKSILNNTELSDVTFSVGKDPDNTKDFPCCRIYFAAQSEVFRKMLYGNMSESKHKSNVIIDDIDPETFEWLQAHRF